MLLGRQKRFSDVCFEAKESARRRSIKSCVQHVRLLMTSLSKEMHGCYACNNRTGIATVTDGCLSCGNVSRNLMGAPRVVPVFRKRRAWCHTVPGRERAGRHSLTAICLWPAGSPQGGSNLKPWLQLHVEIWKKKKLLDGRFDCSNYVCQHSGQKARMWHSCLSSCKTNAGRGIL